jgi:thymidylate synthase
MRIRYDILKPVIKHQEYQYLNLINNIIKKGVETDGRNGKTLSLLGQKMSFDLQDNKLPLITTKKLAWKTCLKELFWFMRGETNNKILNNQNVHIWDGNSSRDFLDGRGLQHLEENDLGPVYGHQWRYYNAEYINSSSNYENKGIDQLQKVVDSLKDDKEKYSRRIILNAWNPCQIDGMALPPCHVLSQYIVKNNELTTILYQRSGDVGLGIPFNIASYSFLTHILAKHCDLKAKEFIHIIGDAHIYVEHKDALKNQIMETPFIFPTIKVLNKYENIDSYSLKDIKVENYKCHKKVTMDMKS